MEQMTMMGQCCPAHATSAGQLLLEAQPLTVFDRQWGKYQRPRQQAQSFVNVCRDKALQTTRFIKSKLVIQEPHPIQTQKPSW